MISIIFGILLIVFLFSLSIFVHELGHLIAAKKCGLQVDAFSIGFGPVLWNKEMGGVDYRISAIPLGGYVALPQMDPTGGAMSHQGESKPIEISPLKKIIVASAGAVMNVLLAMLLAWIVYIIGKPAHPSEVSSQIGFVKPGTQAWEKGLRGGDTVVSINGKPVRSWGDVLTEGVLAQKATTWMVKQGNVTNTIDLDLVKGGWGLNHVPGISGPSYARITGTISGYHAAKAGVQPGDEIIAVNGTNLYSHSAFHYAVQQTQGEKPVQTTLLRDGEKITLSLQPKVTNQTFLVKVPHEGSWAFIKNMIRPQYKKQTHTNYLVGITWSPNAYHPTEKVHPDPWGELRYWAGAIFRFLGALVTPGEAGQAVQGLSGPVGIVAMFWMFKDHISMAFWFTGLLNINLAILNLLPIPILDGGHIIFALWHALRGKPPHPKLVLKLTQLFMIFFLTVFLLITMRDINRFVIEPMQQPVKELPVEDK